MHIQELVSEWPSCGLEGSSGRIRWSPNAGQWPSLGVRKIIWSHPLSLKMGSQRATHIQEFALQWLDCGLQGSSCLIYWSQKAGHHGSGARGYKSLPWNGQAGGWKAHMISSAGRRRRATIGQQREDSHYEACFGVAKQSARRVI